MKFDIEALRTRLPAPVRAVIDILEQTIESWGAHRMGLRAAAISYYALITLAPFALLILYFLSVVPIALDVSTLTSQVGSSTSIAGDSQVASRVAEVADRYAREVGSFGPTITALIALVGVTALFAQFVAALDHIWESKPDVAGWRYFVRKRLLGLAAVITAMIGLIVALVATSVLGLLTTTVQDGLGIALSLPGFLGALADASLWTTLGLLVIVLSLAFTYLPAREIRWTDTLVGSLLTAGAYVLGQGALGAYISRSAVVSAFGAAGTVVAIVIWIYYTSQAVLLGAELTRTLVLRSEEKREHAQA